MTVLVSCSTTKKVNKLFSEANTLSKTFQYKDLGDLPDPVKRYFRYALQDNQPYLSFLRLEHTGTFKIGIGKEWMNIKGEQYFTAHPPGFIWIGKTRMFKAVDSYVANQGNLSVYLFGLLRIVNSNGPTVDQAEMLRWLGESVWMPTNFLPDEHKKWTPMNENSAKITFTHDRHTVFYVVYFNEEGQIIRLETERYMDKDRLEKWVGHVSDYRQVNGMMIPHEITATWMLKEAEHTYARFHVQKFEYDIPEKY
jgi:hypothetical protein